LDAITNVMITWIQDAGNILIPTSHSYMTGEAIRCKLMLKV